MKREGLYDDTKGLNLDKLKDMRPQDQAILLDCILQHKDEKDADKMFEKVFSCIMDKTQKPQINDERAKNPDEN